MARLKEFEDENCRLKKMYAEERFKVKIPREAIEKSRDAVSPPGDGTQSCYKKSHQPAARLVSAKPVFVI